MCVQLRLHADARWMARECVGVQTQTGISVKKKQNKTNLLLDVGGGPMRACGSVAYACICVACGRRLM